MFVYDELGNPTTYRNKNLTWSKGRQLVSFDGIEYKYNADGIRIAKTYNGVTTHFYITTYKNEIIYISFFYIKHCISFLIISKS